jgi:acyl-CoA thioester hydrolase
LRVCGRTAQIGRSSLRFAVAIFRKGRQAAPLIDAQLVYVAADIETKRPAPWPVQVRTKIVDFERVPPLEAARAA